MTRHRTTRPPRRGRLPLRLLAGQALITVLVAVLVGSAVTFYDRLVQAAAEAQLRDTAALTEVFLSQEVHRSGRVLSEVGRMPGVREALRDPTLPGAATRLDRAVASVALTDPGYYSALATDVSGVVRAIRPPIVPVGFDAGRRPWFLHALGAPDATQNLSPVFESVAEPGLHLTTISVPVRESGQVVGVLSVGQRLDWYERFVARYAASHGVRLAIIDQTGVVVADGARRLPAGASLAARRELGQQLLGPATDTVRARVDLPGTATTGRWRVVSEVPRSVAMRPAQIFSAVAIGAGIFLAISLGLLLWLRQRTAAERARAGAVAVQNQRELQDITDSSPDLLFRMDRTGVVRFASRASDDVVGVPAGALVGTNLLDLLEAPGVGDLGALVRHVAEQGEALSVAARTGDVDKRRIVELDVRPSGDPQGGELLGSVRDVTARRSAQDQVEQLFQLTGEFMAVLDFDARLVQVNPIWAAALQRPQRHILGRSFFQFFRFEDLARSRTDFDRMTAGGPVLALESRYTLGEPEQVRSLRWTMAADVDRRLVYAVGHDITQHRELEAALAAARDEAVAASRMKSEFVATMSHEIRTPMNGVVGLTDLLAATPLEPTQRRYVDGVRAAGEALLAVINDILDFSKIEAGRMVLEQVDFRPDDVITDVLTLVGQSAAAKGLRLDALVAPDVPEVVNGDPGRLRQLLLNLMHNAVKFTATGGVTLRALPGPDAGAGRLAITFEVVDTGIGITADQLEELFEPFQQADAGTNREFGGTGLGLSICRRLAELMSGDLAARSTPGLGTTFTADLVFAGPTGEALVQRGDVRSDGRSLTVLIVDTDEDSRVAMANQLADWGMRLIAVGSPDEAVMALAWTGATSGQVDLAIVDVGDGRSWDASPRARGRDEEPPLLGVELIRRLREVDGLGAVPIIAIGEREPLAEHLTELGISSVLGRPVQPSAIFEALSRVALAGSEAPLLDLHPALDPAPVERGDGGRHLLLAEDNEINQMVASGMLARLGHHVDVAADGHEALLKAGRHRYDAILMDCQMPRLDGYAATRELRRRSATRHVPIIAMTAATLDADRQRCFDAGMDDFIAKPVRFAVLQETLERWLDDAARAGAGGDPALEHLAAHLPAPREPADQAPEDGTMEIEQRLAELAGDGSPEELQLVADIVRSFQDRAPTLAARLTAAAETGEARVVQHEAHAFAGAALNVGATATAQACRRLEAAARTGPIGSGTQPAALFVPLLPALHAALSRELHALTQHAQ